MKGRVEKDPAPRLSVAFITVGDTSRLTGGYLYHARIFERLGTFGIEVEEVVPSDAAVGEQEEGFFALELFFDPCKYDIVVVDALARIAAAPFIEEWKEERPVVAMVHELPSLAAPEDDTGEERAFEEALFGADMLIAVSGHGKSVLEGRGVPSGRIRVVSPGSDGMDLEAGEIELREDMAEGDGGFRGSEAPTSPGETGASAGSEALRAICVAQWIERKGVLELVEAWKMANPPNASLHLIGDTDADPEYRSRVTEAIGVDSSISVRGTLDDGSLATAYAESDFFVLPSRYEGYGVVYAEALSFGLPIVACDAGPVPEVVGREAGVFVSPGDVSSISREIENLLADGNLRRRMSEAAFRRTGSLPRWDDTARGFAEVLREAVYG